MSSTEQAVVEKPDEKPEASTEGHDALDDLDALLEEGSEKPAAQQTEDKLTPDEIADLRALRQQSAETAFETALQDAASVVKGESSMPDEIAEGLVHSIGRRDPKLQKAWDNRGANPQAWGAAKKVIAERASKVMETWPDKAVSETVSAVESAVRSASTKTPQEEAPPDFASMSDHEMNQWKRANGGW